ncbi:precorrin-6y C5,15-methyltransferase (decarboxylating) subunit CbiE [Nocardioides anomalus]|uniref:Precorrin-6y C5,15-methyltransferase (Decarboxylating) subunit CbiE n=1 Tax=Nocardioides anomalus TaxID=2712223 RepID=A0A6G6WLE0_9ACTN|nr:precorrin-6y C5,15-methyltransferase (decarboxylating) subunit CbiE [Nocardioides anomalus]
MPSRVTVVGVPADGWPGLGDPARELVSHASVVLGSTRQLGLLPDVAGQERVAWPSPFSLAPLEAYADRELVVLASGDPYVSGIASTLLRTLGPDRLTVVPTVSSVSLARARMHWDDAEVVTVVGRRLEAVLRHLAPGHRVLVLSSDEHTPQAVARLLVEADYGATVMTALGDLGTDLETRNAATAAEGGPIAPRLHVLALELRGPATGQWTAGLPDEAYEHDGQLTKRDLRASALARLAPYPGALLWDVGAGAGSVGIEWLRSHPLARAVAVEADATRAQRIGRNAATLGVPGLEVVTGRAPEALEDLPDPDAVFVGGGATAPGVLDTCRERLRPGGRVVVHGVTLETERLLLEQYAEHGGELTRLSVERAEPLAGFTGWTPARPVVQWAWSRP